MAKRPYLTSLPEKLQAKILTEVSNHRLKYVIRARAACKSFANVKKKSIFHQRSIHIKQRYAFVSQKRNVRVFGAARIDFPGFNEVGREDHFYLSADLLFMNTWYDNGTAVATFKDRCYQLGNPEAIFKRGMYELYRLHLIDEWMGKIRDAGDKGLALAKYVDAMLRLTLTVDERGKVNNYPALTHNFLARMAKILLRLEIGLDAWNERIERPSMFVETVNRINLRCVHRCRCNETDPTWNFTMNFVDSLQICDSCYWQLEAWRFCDYINFLN